MKTTKKYTKKATERPKDQKRRKPLTYIVDRETFRQISKAGLFQQAYRGRKSDKETGKIVYRVAGTPDVLDFLAEHAPDVLKQKESKMKKEENEGFDEAPAV